MKTPGREFRKDRLSGEGHREGVMWDKRLLGHG